MKKILVSALFIMLFISHNTFAQTKNTGPIIEEFGKVFRVENPDVKIDINKEFKVVFEVTSSPEDLGELNLAIETVARFLNMHAQSGVPPHQLKVALVIHNKATKDLINDSAYQKRYQIENPNSKLVKSLLDEGVQVIICGQSIVSRGFDKTELIPEVQISLSAMTALIQLNGEGYTILKL
ncbi:DsrE family protein [Sediminicola arcticus]|jgi:intracellular sulfur oxidation DsrE/DsrF family protein|uniref:DsrE family protein n=1 Tax=Sediminicola arcticus TaxID=1574308 RepID=A0ABV2SU69_9FLAO|tara:strand:- start:30 stop:572 length:543 start_codon:yes stop_codon:yes gene_type:complete